MPYDYPVKSSKLRTSVLLLMVPLFVAVAQSCNKAVAPPDRANERLAGIMRVYSDTTEVWLTDFFPAFGNVDSVTVGTGMSLIGSDPGWETFTVAAVSGRNYISSFSVWQDGKSFDVPVLVPDGKNETAEPNLFTLGHEKNRVLIGYTSRPEQVVALWQNRLLDTGAVSMEDGHIEITIPEDASGMDRSFLRVYASGNQGIFTDILVPLRKNKPVASAATLDRHDPHAQVLYSLMIDRFYNGNPDNDMKLNDPEVLDIVDYQGGDIAGITRKIRDGYFNRLGITTIWISPVTQNPYDAWGLNQNPRTRFSGYHGYWPIYTTKLDDRFATEEEFREMLEVAHSHGLNVILDYVANHLHIESPVLMDHPDWTTPLELPDGRLNLELWDEQRLTTWFDLHIPSLDTERPEVYMPMTDSALYWLENFDLDGFRHDATKHIPEVYWRTLTSKMVERMPERRFYQIGETYGSSELIGSYVRSGMLDGQFDFNVYDRTIDALVRPDGSFDNVARTIADSHGNYGSHNLMGYISGNHDRARFISYAGGSLSLDEDAKAAGWTREIARGDSTAYPKLVMLEGLMLTIPGVPCIYQGDEYGEPGGNDPDNRRMMRFAGLDSQEQGHLETVTRLIHMRRNSLPLIYGDYLPLLSEEDILVFARVYMGEVVIVAFNKSDAEREIIFELPEPLTGEGLEMAFVNPSREKSRNDVRAAGQNVLLTLQPLSFEILIQK